VALYLDAPPLCSQNTFLIDQEGASVDAHVFLAVPLFEFDDIKELAQCFVLVGDQVERELVFCPEVLL
jgi:hypothetical protein